MHNAQQSIGGPLRVTDTDAGLRIEHAPCPAVAGVCDTAPVIGADGGLSSGGLSGAIATLDRTLASNGGAPAEWHAFAEQWRARLRQRHALRGPELQQWAERLAQLAERLSATRGYQTLPPRGGDGESLRIARARPGDGWSEFASATPGPWGSSGDAPEFAVIAGNDAEVSGGIPGIPSEVRAVDDALSGVWTAIKPIVPYGEAIDTLHRTRRGLMYGSEAADPALVRQAQDTTRRARKGESAAMAEVRQLKEAARGDEAARRRWHVYVSVMRDDSKRIDRLTEGGPSGAPSGSGSPFAGLFGARGPGGGSRGGKGAGK